MTDEANEQRPALTAAARKELLNELAGTIGETAIIEGDRLIVETGNPVALYVEMEPDGNVRLTWWMTANAPVGNPNWAEAASSLLGAGESIHTSALGGGFLVEVTRTAGSIAEAAALAIEGEPAERVREIADAFPAAVAALPPAPVPDYLLPNREGA